MKFKNTRLLSALACAMALAAPTAQAQESQGVSKTEITLGSIQDLSGPLAGFGKQLRNGMMLRVNEVNEQGGVHGRKINLLVEEGLLEAQINPTHKRSPRFALTRRGRSIYADLERTQARWAKQLAKGLSIEDLAATHRVLNLVCERLESSSNPGTRP